MRGQGLKNLSNTAWRIVDVPGVIGTGTNIFDIHFFVGEEEFSSMKFEDQGDNGALYFNSTKIVEYPVGEWTDEKYQNISIDGGLDAENPALIAWLQKYAKNQNGSASYAGIVGALNNVASAVRGDSSANGSNGVRIVPVVLLEESHYAYIDMEAKELYDIIKKLDTPVYISTIDEQQYEDDGVQWVEERVLLVPIVEAYRGSAPDVVMYAFKCMSVDFQGFVADSDNAKPTLQN